MIHVVGAGLAGVEAAFQLGRRGLPVVLHEMRPTTSTAAHNTGDCAELVCSNTLGSLMPHTAPGVFKRELEQLGSLVVAAGRRAHVPAGGALAVDRELFSAIIEDALSQLPRLERRNELVKQLPGPQDGRWILATGPLTAEPLAGQLHGLCGADDLYFYDAIAPIVDLDSVDMERAYWGNRYGEEGEGDYLNLPLDRHEYEAFIDALLAGEQVPARDFEEERFFQGCQPIEAIAGKGRESLRFGPMKPVGLRDPRTGQRPWAVVQLRREKRQGSAMNLVGFQTKLRYGAQTNIFRMIPALADAEFLRLGSVHRNTYLNSPRVLDSGLRIKAQPNVSVAGQLVGCEGYTESSAMGLWAALSLVAERSGEQLPPPPADTFLGALLGYLREAPAASFAPMNVNFGLLPAPTERVRKSQRKAHRTARGEACVASLRQWRDDQLPDLAELGPRWLHGSEPWPLPSPPAPKPSRDSAHG
ncbi:MAG: methylenetetrahydrofolate--tRNA-(uracil(54)-C(5))-methyltransferase (FADH(2)-oxidizing) TrmFO [Rickettsiales bacterium]|nr:methylenetetrahydrofolate--tRNA-(uracil(54)-C(5))-methyltransferase (FADH(2)-oxidizing) TrmFO [Rickettsiales bacterium]